jgi:hypothetical protein
MNADGKAFITQEDVEDYRAAKETTKARPRNGFVFQFSGLFRLMQAKGVSVTVAVGRFQGFRDMMMTNIFRHATPEEAADKQVWVTFLLCNI